ncbi:MAG: hypothetical protein JZD41_01375, partial [Thermoproteus sp.]|nr:hypothetical protein [Thermoproteus sp.]
EERRGNRKWLYLSIKISPAGLLENPKPGDVVELVIATPKEWAECRRATPQQIVQTPQPQSQTPQPPLPPMLAENQWVKALRARPLYDRKAGGWASEA